MNIGPTNVTAKVNFLYKSDIGFNGYEQELPTKSQKLINAQLIWTRTKQQEQ
jgi:hypothetical protein